MDLIRCSGLEPAAHCVGNLVNAAVLTNGVPQDSSRLAADAARGTALLQETKGVI